MGTGWRRAFCTSVRGDAPGSSAATPSPSPRSRLSLFGFHTTTTPTPTNSNPSTPRHQHPPPPPTTDTTTPSPSLRCRTTTITNTNEEAPPPKSSSPRSPSRFTFFKNTLRLSRSSSCGICLRSLKAAKGTAIFIAECSHAFHFPCISSHVKKRRALSCPVCSATWRQSPRLSLESTDDDANSGGWRAAIERVRALKREHEVGYKQKNKCPTHNSSYCSPPAKAYNDDETLLSPGGSRFNPIPEADEDDHPPGTRDRNPSLDVAFSPDVALLSSSRAHESHVVPVKVKAASAAAAAAGGRAPVDLVAVIDAGGAITAAKFHVLKGALRAVVASLGAGDRLSVVAFSSAAMRLLPLRRMNLQGQRAAARAADRLARSADGSGASADALRKANRILEDRRERNPVSGVVVLSDAQQHHPTKTPRYASSVACWASSTAASCGTRYAHIEVPVPGDEMPETTLANCVTGLLSVVAQDVRVEVSSPSGEITAFYSPRGQPPASGSPRSISLGDLYADEERELLMEVRVPAVAEDCTITVRCTYRNPTTREEVACGARTRVLHRHRGRHVSPETEAVRNAYVATRAVAESRRLAEVNELTAAARLLESARAVLRRSGAAAVAMEGARAVEAELAEVQRRRRRRREAAAAAAAETAEALTPTSAWRAAERLAKVAMMRKSLNRRVSDLHGFEDARF